MLDLDISILQSLVGDEPDIVARLLETYVRSVGTAATQLRRAMAARDAAAVHAAAHLIKSPSLSVGAVPLGKLCAGLEQAAGKADWACLDALFISFEPALERVACVANEYVARVAV